jgi:hypothetical protein
MASFNFLPIKVPRKKKIAAFTNKCESFFQIVPRILLNEAFDQEARLLFILDVRVQQEPSAMFSMSCDAIAIHNAEVVRVQDALCVRLRLQRDALILFVIQDFLSEVIAEHSLFTINKAPQKSGNYSLTWSSTVFTVPMAPKSTL